MRKVILCMFIIWLSACRSDEDWLLLTTTPENVPPTIAVTVTLPAIPTIAPTSIATIEPTPTGEWLERGLPESPFQIVNLNAELIGYHFVDQWISVTAGYITQAIPDDFTDYNLLRTVDGQTGTTHHTAYAPITTSEESEFVFAIGAIAGEWGFTQTTRVSAGCYILKISGDTSILDAAYNDHPYNYSMAIYIHRGNAVNTALPRFTLPQQGTFGISHYSGDLTGNSFWALYIGAPGSLTYTVAVKASYATAAPESTITVANIALALDPTNTYCDSTTPGF